MVPSAPLAGDTDYSDPFDARLDHRPEPDLGPVPCENNGYMEPYEAQRVITGQWNYTDHQSVYYQYYSVSLSHIVTIEPWSRFLLLLSF